MTSATTSFAFSATPRTELTISLWLMGDIIERALIEAWRWSWDRESHSGRTALLTRCRGVLTGQVITVYSPAQ